MLTTEYQKCMYEYIWIHWYINTELHTLPHPKGNLVPPAGNWDGIVSQAVAFHSNTSPSLHHTQASKKHVLPVLALSSLSSMEVDHKVCFLLRAERSLQVASSKKFAYKMLPIAGFLCKRLQKNMKDKHAKVMRQPKRRTFRLACPSFFFDTNLYKAYTVLSFSFSFYLFLNTVYLSNPFYIFLYLSNPFYTFLYIHFYFYAFLTSPNGQCIPMHPPVLLQEAVHYLWAEVLLHHVLHAAG